MKDPMFSIMKQNESQVKELGQNSQYSGAGVFCALHLKYEMLKEGPPKEEEKKAT